MTDSLTTIFLFGGAGGVLGSLAGLLYSLFGNPGESLRVGNSMGLGFLLNDEYIQASAGPQGFRFPELPNRGEDSPRDPVELWIRTRNAKVNSEVLGMWNIAQDLLRTFMPQDADVPESLRGQAVAEKVQNWVVIAIWQTSIR